MPDTQNPIGNEQASRINWRAILLAVAVSFLALFAGVFGSIYSDNIKNAAPFCFFDTWSLHSCCGQIAWHVVIFWVFAMLATGLFFYAQYDSERCRMRETLVGERRREKEAEASEVHRRNAAAELRATSDELKELIRTVPPETFLVEFKTLFRECSEAKEVVHANHPPSRAEVEKAIRVICAGVAALAQLFDRQGADVLYAVNVMRFRAADSLAETDIPDIKKRLRFVPPETEPKNLRGVLDLQTELSTSTKGSRYERDITLLAIALPVPVVETVKIGDSERWRVLPGAPLAFCGNRPDGYEDMKTLAEWCETEGTFDAGVIKDIREYFAVRSTTIRSLIALPLSRFDGSGESIGVLNIHSERPGLLNVERMEKQFVPMISPFQAMLIDLMDLLDATS